jgi:hypothetical protein
MQLLRFTAISRDGRKFPTVLSTTEISRIEVDTREGSNSKSVVHTRSDRSAGTLERYYILESLEDLGIK